MDTGAPPSSSSFFLASTGPPLGLGDAAPLAMGASMRPVREICRAASARKRRLLTFALNAGLVALFVGVAAVVLVGRWREKNARLNAARENLSGNERE
jgi:hypothetical protein